MTCPNGHVVDGAAKFCPECGVALVEEQPAVGWDEAERLAAERAQRRKEEQERVREEQRQRVEAQRRQPFPNPRPTAESPSGSTGARWWTRRPVIAAGGGVICLLLAIGLLAGHNSKPSATSATNDTTTAASTPAPKPPPRPTRYAQLLPHTVTVRQAASASCPGLKTVINQWTAAEQSRSAQLPSDTADVYAVAAFVAKPGTGWIRAQTQQAYEAQIAKTTASTLATTVGLTKARLITDQMRATYQRAALNVCGLTVSNRQLDNKLAALDSRTSTLIDFAKSKPWYPAGYSEFDDNVAFKWDNNVPKCNQDNSLDGSYCWGMLILTRHGCPSSLYAEINITQGSTVIDFSNDTLGSLSSGEVGELGFQAYENTSGTLEGQLKTVDCY